jgi:hypothetical protein
MSKQPALWTLCIKKNSKGVGCGVWNNFTRLWKGSSGSLLLARWWTFMLNKIFGIGSVLHNWATITDS